MGGIKKEEVINFLRKIAEMCEILAALIEKWG